MCEHAALGLAHCKNRGREVHGTRGHGGGAAAAHDEAVGIQKGFPEKLTSTLRLEGGVEIDSRRVGRGRELHRRGPAVCRELLVRESVARSGAGSSEVAKTEAM